MVIDQLLESFDPSILLRAARCNDRGCRCSDGDGRDQGDAHQPSLPTKKERVGRVTANPAPPPEGAPCSFAAARRRRLRRGSSALALVGDALAFVPARRWEKKVSRTAWLFEPSEISPLAPGRHMGYPHCCFNGPCHQVLRLVKLGATLLARPTKRPKKLTSQNARQRPGIFSSDSPAENARNTPLVYRTAASVKDVLLVHRLPVGFFGSSPADDLFPVAHPEHHVLLTV